MLEALVDQLLRLNRTGNAMRRTALSMAVALSCVACAPLPRPVVAAARPALSSEELSVIAAVVKTDIELYRSERPVLLLDETTSWMPPPRE